MFVNLSFIVGPRFYKYPIINNILKDENIAPHHRIKAIIKKMESNWDEVKEIEDWDVYCREFATKA